MKENYLTMVLVVAGRMKMTLKEEQATEEMLFVFDVESVGLHGWAFAVGYVIVDKKGRLYEEGTFATAPKNVSGTNEGYFWVAANVPTCAINYNCKTYNELTWMFWNVIKDSKTKYKNITFWADCAWPVETNFLSECTKRHSTENGFDGPYPLHDIATLLLVRGKNPTDNFPRQPDELPAHHPLCDAKQSARILLEHL